MSVEIETRGVGVSLHFEGERETIKIIFYGKLHHRDYEVMIPVLGRAIQAAKDREVDLLVDMRKLEGWSLHAALDDLRLGVELSGSFEKMAVVGDKKWQELSTRLYSHLIRGQARFFESEEAALAWLRESTDTRSGK